MGEKQKLISFLKICGVLITPEIIHAFETIDRVDFVRLKDKFSAYTNIPLTIGHGQTISQPYTVAFMLEKLEPKEGDRVLDIGSGSGWTTALLGFIVGENGKVTGLERVPELVKFGQHNLSKYGLEHTKIEVVKEGVLGKPNQKFDKILVSAAAQEIPKDLIEQLNPNGILVIPVRNSIYKIAKDENGKVYTQEFPGFVFVPLLN